MKTGMLLAALADLATRVKGGEEGPGDPQAEVPVDMFGGNNDIKKDAARLPDGTLPLQERETGTINDKTTVGFA